MPDMGLGRGNGSLSLNYRRGKVNLFGNGSVYSGQNENTNDIYRTIPFEGNVTVFDQRSVRRSNYQNYSLRVGMDYSLTDKTTIGVLALGIHATIGRNPTASTTPTFWTET